MSALLKIYILFNFCYILIECVIPGPPNLSVRKVDKRLIEQKRKDTWDMCRIFNAETRQTFTKPLIVNKNRVSRKTTIRRHRAKRDVNTPVQSGVTLPVQNVEDAQRVEKIVDRIYDDLLEKGQNISYTRRPFVTAETVSDTTSQNNPQNNQNEVNSNLTESGRRLNFAPLVLLPPNSTSKKPDTDVYVDQKPPRFRHGIVPYFIDSNTYDAQLAEVIMKAFDYFEKATCIRLQRLRERPNDMDSMQNVVWLYITNPSGIRQCVHSNDRVEIKGVQMIVFGYDCMSLGDIIHEVMHILGFSHEHLRPDRDEHITILWDNIKPGYRKYFEIQKKQILDSLPYDYESILHYPPRAFSRNGQVTILTEPGNKIGQREKLSELDIEKINLLYSNECVKRNREYLLKTCPSVVKADTSPVQVTQKEIEDYFHDRLWPFGVVHYRLKDKMDFTIEEIENIKAVISHIEKETCIEFRDLTNSASEWPNSTESDSKEDSDKVVVLDDDAGRPSSPRPVTLPGILSSSEEQANEIKDEGRSGKPARKKRAVPSIAQRRHISSVLVFTRSPHPGCFCPHPGRPTGSYMVKISTDCFNSVNDLLHVFVHILGLDHQHNMHDRDNYLHISWDQLSEDISKEMKLKLPPAASVGFPYDYQSVMHYPWLQIKNGRTNIMYPIWNDGWAMGHWQGLSSTDVQKLNLLYFKECVQRKQNEEQPGGNE